MTDFRFQNLEHYRGLPDRCVFSVSGGRSSGYQFAHIVAANEGKIKPDWFFEFSNTGLEREPTYVFLWRLEQYFGQKIHWLEYAPDEPTRVREVDYWSAARDGEPMEAMLSEIMNRRDGTRGVRPLPNPVQRTCTANLKVKTSHRFVRKHLGWPMIYHNAIGYRADEPKRVLRRQKLDMRSGREGGIGIFPMFDNFVIQDDVDNFFRLGPFDLQLDSDFGNCDFCFMVSTWKIKSRMLHVALEDGVRIRPGAEPPARVQRWINWEERQSDRPGNFRLDRPNMRTLWQQVCEGDFESAVPEWRNDRCGSCTD